jgi:spore cortex biosynthesis protein YabQ
MTLTTQFYTLLAMIGMGGFYGAALDTYNRFLKRSQRKRWIVFMHDVLFWVIQGLLIFYVLFLVNEGEFRFYLFLALLCGFSAYQALFKNLYRSSLEMFIKIVIKIFEFFVKSFQILIFLPIKWMVTVILTLLIGIWKTLFFLLKWVGKLLLIIVKIILKPFQWTLIKIWNRLPATVTKKVGKFYNTLTGILLKCKNIIKTFINKWRKEKD